MIVRTQSGPRSLRRRSLHRCVAAVLGLGLTVSPVSVTWASIRLDGSQYQSMSEYVGTPENQRTLSTSENQAVRPAFIVMTVGQAVMARGALPGASDSTVAFKIGMGYEYNFWQTALQLGCACSCHSDPVCDGQWNVLDVVAAANVAFRGGEPNYGDNCPNALTDINCDGKTDLLDVVGLVNIAFHEASPGDVLCAPCVD